tara:strand:- start:346 stop:570 length:225 start_codon:yes stop_codon:yes gene_type:complete
MKIGDLVQLKMDHYKDDKNRWFNTENLDMLPTFISGLVISLESDFCAGTRVTVQWLDGERSCEPSRALRIISEG